MDAYANTDVILFFALGELANFARGEYLNFFVHEVHEDPLIRLRVQEMRAERAAQRQARLIADAMLSDACERGDYVNWSGRVNFLEGYRIVERFGELIRTDKSPCGLLRYALGISILELRAIAHPIGDD